MIEAMLDIPVLYNLCQTNKQLATLRFEGKMIVLYNYCVGCIYLSVLLTVLLACFYCFPLSIYFYTTKLSAGF